jgi:hypothetical protein
LFQPIGFVERKLKHAQGGLSPATNRRVSNTVKLDSATMEAMSTTFVSGDMAMVSDAPDGASTGPAVCFYNGTDWKFMLFSGLTTL